MKYVFTPFAAESRSLSKSDCTRSQLGYGDYLSDNDYSYTYNMFVHDAYYKWSYFTIDDLADKFTKLPYVAGDEIYFVLGSELDKFIEIVSKTVGDNFKFVEKSDFYEWALCNGNPRLKEIADNYFKNTKSSYVQFKDLNVGEVFKLTNATLIRDVLFVKVDPRDTKDSRDNAVVLTGDRKGYTIKLIPEANVEIVRDLNDVPAECFKDKSSFKELINKYKDNFMTYGGVPTDVIKYTKSDCINTWRLYEEMGNTIKKVIFNGPATIVIWGDGSKTVVKCQKRDKFDPEKGLAMAISKKFLGNDYGYYETFAKYVGRYNKKHKEK